MVRILFKIHFPLTILQKEISNIQPKFECQPSGNKQNTEPTLFCLTDKVQDKFVFTFLMLKRRMKVWRNLLIELFIYIQNQLANGKISMKDNFYRYIKPI